MRSNIVWAHTKGMGGLPSGIYFRSAFFATGSTPNNNLTPEAWRQERENIPREPKGEKKDCHGGTERVGEAKNFATGKRSERPLTRRKSPKLIYCGGEAEKRQRVND